MLFCLSRRRDRECQLSLRSDEYLRTHKGRSMHLKTNVQQALDQGYALESQSVATTSGSTIFARGIVVIRLVPHCTIIATTDASAKGHKWTLVRQ